MTITDWIQAISTVILVIITGIYAWRTFAISKATEKQAEATVQIAKQMVKPTLIPDFRLIGDPILPYLQFAASVHNEGNGCAYDIKVKIQDYGKPPSVLASADIAPVLRAHDSADWLTSNPTLHFPKCDSIQRRLFVIEYKDIDGEYEIRQPFVLTRRENNEASARPESISKRILSKRNLEDELP